MIDLFEIDVNDHYKLNIKGYWCVCVYNLMLLRRLIQNKQGSFALST